MSGSTLVIAVGGGARLAGAVLRVCEKPGAAAIAMAAASSDNERKGREDRKHKIAFARLAVFAFKDGSAATAELYQLRTKVRLEEVVDAAPRIAQHVLAREVVELARVGHERHEVALPLSQQLVYEPYGMQVRHVHVGRAVQDQQRPLQSIDMRQRGSLGVDLGMLLRRADAARRLTAVVRIVVVHLVVDDTGNVDAGAEELRLVGDGAVSYTHLTLPTILRV